MRWISVPTSGNLILKENTILCGECSGGGLGTGMSSAPGVQNLFCPGCGTQASSNTAKVIILPINKYAFLNIDILLLFF